MPDDLTAIAARAVAAIGTEVRSEEFRTGSHRLAQFAGAIGDAANATGRIAPPTFAHVPVMQSMVEVMGRVTVAFALHGEHDYVFHAPIVPGQRLHSRSRLTGVQANRAGLMLRITSETATQDGAMICTQVSTVLVTGQVDPVTAGDPPPPRPEVGAGQVHMAELPVSPALTLAYADAARDYSAYCLNADDAAALGFPAPIVHGMLTLSLAATALVAAHAGGDSTRLRRLGCRFSQPLYSREGERLMLSHHGDGSGGDGSGLLAFSATDGTGRPVLTRGYAEVSA